MTLRVLHVIPSLSAGRGGSSVAAIEMVQALLQAGTNIEIATTNDDCENVLDVELGKLVQHQHVPVRFFARFSPPINSLREFQLSLSFANWLRKNIDQYDVVHVHALFSFCSSFAMWLARKRGIPYIAHPIGLLERWPLQQSQLKKRLYLKLLESNNIRQAGSVHFTAESEKQQALEVFPELKHDIIPLGIHMPTQISDAASKLRQHFQLDERKPIILFLSRIHPKKGLELLLEALAKNSGTAQLLIAGDGDAGYIDQLKQLVEKHDLQRNVRFLGFVRGTEKNLLLQGADLFALTSYSENFGIVVIEALAAGTPVLLTRPVALSAAVEESKVGYLADTNPASVNAALTRALEDINKGIKYGHQAKAYVERNHHWPTIGRQLSVMYEKVIKSAKN